MKLKSVIQEELILEEKKEKKKKNGNKLNWIAKHQGSFVVVENEEWTYTVIEKKPHWNNAKKTKSKICEMGLQYSVFYHGWIYLDVSLEGKWRSKRLTYRMVTWGWIMEYDAHVIKQNQYCTLH